MDGLQNVLSNISKEIEGIKNRSLAGLFEAGLKVQALAQKRTPVDSGNLRASAYTRKTVNGGVEVGFTALYAMSVHEMVGQKLKGQPREDFGGTGKGEGFGGGTGKGKYWDSGQPKFLESALRDNRKNIVDIIAEHSKIK